MALPEVTSGRKSPAGDQVTLCHTIATASDSTHTTVIATGRCVASADAIRHEFVRLHVRVSCARSEHSVARVTISFKTA